MSHFLEGLDQWSLGILMGICTFFGVKELPPEPDPNWKVEQQWVKQPDGHYLLVISSETIQDQCRNGSAKYIVFPQTYMAKQEVYADGMRVYTNEMDKEWHLKSFLDRPIVACDLLEFAKNIKFKILSYSKYFDSIGSWPVGRSSYPREQFFYNLSYMVAGIVALLGSFSFFILGVFFKEKNFQFLIIGLALFMVMYSHYPAYSAILHVHVAHQLSLLGILIVAYAIIFEKNMNATFLKKNIGIMTLIGLEFFISYSYPDTAQLLMLINASVGLLLGSIFMLKEKILIRKIMLLVIIVFGARDLYNGHVLRGGFLNLSLLCLIITFFMIYRMVLRLYNKNLILIKTQEKFEHESLMIEKTRETNLRIKQIIHDMKSPVTSLNFMMSSGNLVASTLLIPIGRLNKLLQMSSEENISILSDWYSIKILDNAIWMVVEEKKHMANNISYAPLINKDVSVFFDPDTIKLLIAEFIDNSIKNNEQNIKIEMSLVVNDSQEVVFRYKDYGVGISKEKISNIGLHGYSGGGTGIGIFTIFERLKSIGAKVDIMASDREGFLAEIKFLNRS